MVSQRVLRKIIKKKKINNIERSLRFQLHRNDRIKLDLMLQLDNEQTKTNRAKETKIMKRIAAAATTTKPSNIQ